MSSLDPSCCDITLTVNDTKQHIATEGYPFSYKEYQDCRFNFVAPPGRKFIVMFEDFNLADPLRSDFLHFRKLCNIKGINTHSCTHIHTKTNDLQSYDSLYLDKWYNKHTHSHRRAIGNYSTLQFSNIWKLFLFEKKTTLVWGNAPPCWGQKQWYPEYSIYI